MPVKSNRNGPKNPIYQSSDAQSQDDISTNGSQIVLDDVDDSDKSIGHTRSPVFSREPTMLESFSRTVRNYVPSSIPIPAAAPSPPTVSRPFVTSASRASSAVFDDGLPSGLAQAMSRSTTGADPILWTKWDILHGRRLLILGYATGIQVWDCTALGSVSEVLNLTDFPDDVVYAAVLPGHSAMGILTNEFNLLVYSFSSHDIIKRIPLSTPAYTFTANQEFIVLSSTNPPALQILASATFQHIHTIPSTSLVSSTDGSSPPHPIVTLSRRLLAYASVSPPQVTSISHPLISPSKPISSTAKSMMSGMRALGGFAFSAAVNTLGGEATTPVNGGRFFSRSAPAGSGTGDPISYSPTEDQTATESGHYITVLDLRSRVNVACFLASENLPLSTLSFSPDGCSLLSIAKDGQVARVYRLQFPSGGSALTGDDTLPLHVYDLRRGRTTAVVEGVEWSNDGRWIAIGTRKKTLHVFAVNPYGGPPDKESHLSGRVVNPHEMQPASVEVAPIVRLRPTSHPVHSNANGHNGVSSLSPTFKLLDSLPQTLPPSLLPISSPLPVSVPIPSSSPSSPGSPHHPQPQQLMKNFQDMLVFNPVDGLLQLRRWVLSAEMTRSSSKEHLSALGGTTSVSLPPGTGISSRTGTSPRDRSRRLSSTGISPDIVASGGDAKVEGEMKVTKESVVASWDLKRRHDWAEVKKRFSEKGSDDASKATDFLSEAELETSSKSHKVLPRSIYLSHQFSFHTLGEDYHALIRRYQFDIPGTKIEVRKQVQVSAYTTSHGGGESFVEGSPVSRRDLSFDEPLASAMLQADGFPDRSRVGTVLPMLPNGHGHTTRIPSIPIRGVSGSWGRLRKEMMVPRTSGRKKSGGGGGGGPMNAGMSMSVPLEFDEDDEDFAPQVPASHDGIGSSGIELGIGMTREDSTDSQARTEEDEFVNNSHSDSSTNMYLSDPEEGRGGAPVYDDAWNDGWGVEDKKAIEEVEMYDHISAVGFLDEEQEEMDRKMREEQKASAAAASSRTAISKGRHTKGKKKGGKK